VLLQGLLRPDVSGTGQQSSGTPRVNGNRKVHRFRFRSRAGSVVTRTPGCGSPPRIRGLVRTRCVGRPRGRGEGVTRCSQHDDHREHFTARPGPARPPDVRRPWRREVLQARQGHPERSQRRPDARLLALSPLGHRAANCGVRCPASRSQPSRQWVAASSPVLDYSRSTGRARAVPSPFVTPSARKRRGRAKEQRNHNPRVGGSSPSSGIESACKSALFGLPGHAEYIPRVPRLQSPRYGGAAWWRASRADGCVPRGVPPGGRSIPRAWVGPRGRRRRSRRRTRRSARHRGDGADRS
jgi:hypothetical protein